ncbi:N-acetylglucosamine transport system permease protein [Paenibacillus shirakamiensis]|uniref:N-acetylglucosamine transport system permease protein n=1 Tax=Paenibacillus shirakamiensis TaxID=1265935 RepID=A0ABS4JER1_9BACL|nr:carbohydrate ABC transporter permease [Paenibacillus shirakamiensis]MBP2000190.1 N-acetylglucosamine transport system permease protein [Paenibacillus shirakamiensis]
MYPSQPRFSRHILKALSLILLVVWSVAVLYPLIWTGLGALKDNSQFMLGKPWAFPRSPWLWSNFSNVWNQYHFGQYFINSIVVTAISSLLAILLSATTAYVLARFPFRGSQILYYFYLSAMMIPMILGLIPLFFLLNDLNLINKLSGLIIVYTAWALPFSIFVMVSFFKTLPKELEEAAYIDGAGYYRTFFDVMLPLARSGLISIGIMNALNTWNEYIMGMVFVNDPVKYTIPVGIAVMQAEMQYRTEWGPLFAGLLMSMLPVIIVYMLFQRHIVAGVTAGAVK